MGGLFRLAIASNTPLSVAALGGEESGTPMAAACLGRVEPPGVFLFINVSESNPKGPPVFNRRLDRQLCTASLPDVEMKTALLLNRRI